MLPRIMRAGLTTLLLVWVLGGCAVRPSGVADLEYYPQDATAFLQAGTAETWLVAPEVQARLDAGYNSRFFAPWRQQQASLPSTEAFWGVASYGGK